MRNFSAMPICLNLPIGFAVIYTGMKGKLWFILLLVAFWACNAEKGRETNASSSTEETPTEVIPFTVGVDRLRFRQAPGTDAEIISELGQGVKVSFADSISTFITSVTLRGIDYNDPWVRVKTAAGKTGWVYGGALQFDPELNAPVIRHLMKTRLIAFFGADHFSMLQRARQNWGTASDSESLAAQYASNMAIRDTLSDSLLEQTESPDAYQLQADLNWLNHVLPGFTARLVAEGTIYQLFADYRQWYDLATQTPELDDDAFFELCFSIYPLDSTEHLFEGWFAQNWDYGGHSLLGQGIHQSILDQMQELTRQTSHWDPFINSFKARLFKDMTESWVTYWEPSASIRKELDQIIQANYDIFTPEEKDALIARRKAFDDPKANNIQVNQKF